MCPASEEQKNGENPSDQGLLGERKYYALDDKGRFAIPADKRKGLGSPEYVYLMPDLHERCLALFSPADMEGRLESLRQRPLHDRKASRARRILGENLQRAAIDGQGRVRICERLLKFAMLEGSKEVAVVGQLHHLQVWSPVLLPEAEPVDQGALAEVCEDVGF